LLLVGNFAKIKWKKGSYDKIIKEKNINPENSISILCIQNENFKNIKLLLETKDMSLFTKAF